MNEVKKGETKDVKNPFYKELWFIITVIVLSVIILLSSTLGLYFGLRKDARISGFKIDNIGKYYDDDNVFIGLHEEFNFNEQIMPWSYSLPSQKRIVQWDGEVEVEVFLVMHPLKDQYRLAGSILLKDFTSTVLYTSPDWRYYSEISINEGFIESSEYSESVLSKGNCFYTLFDNFESTYRGNYYDYYTGELEAVINIHTILNDYLGEQEYVQQGPISTLNYQETASYAYEEGVRLYMDGSLPDEREFEEYENGRYHSYTPIQGFQFEETYKPEEFKFENSLYIS